ncbi:MAG: 4Fe-4S binding protein [Alphaproteobacteria bacterium]|jgi:ferredoxin|nr:4Fe-4S binding protein [Alphaproteobacteria bacterium]MBT7943858.1 4Fe-4S binding protein [Alphaproteobacteria bacterium]
MKLNQQEVLVCNCEGTMTIDGKAVAKACAVAPDAKASGDLSVANHLCRAEIEEFQRVAKGADGLLVACTQEAPLFLEALDDFGIEAPAIRFANIREKAGWSKDAGGTAAQKTDMTAKIAALLAEATLDIEDSNSVTMTSEGVLVILGSDDHALEAAAKLSNRLDVTVILEPGTQASSPRVMDVPVFTGRITGAEGHLGQFRVSVEDFVPASPSSKGGLKFDGAPQKGTSEADLILDLRGGASLFPAPEKRDGYFNPDPGNPALVAGALFELTDLVGSFEKPRYVDYDAAICAHSRATITGCSRCIDSCPTGAIEPNGDKVEFDPYVCAGCGTCASVCPTGAARYNLPAGETLFRRLRTILRTYALADGQTPRLLVHDTGFGEDMIATLAQGGDGLPANVLPFVVNQVTQVGLDFLFAASAFGAERVLVLLSPNKADERPALEAELALADTVLDGLGYGAGHFDIIDDTDPDAFAQRLNDLKALTPLPGADFLPMGRKRSVMSLALAELHKTAPSPIDAIELPVGAPFGTVNVDTEGCTLCLACAGACPTGALRDNENKPQLNFTEQSCVQCGLCRNTCPESVITLTPQLNFLATAGQAQVVKEEDPFECIRCGKAFGTKSSIEAMVEKLEDHPMFQEKGGTDRLKMCDECRVFALAEEDAHPMASAARPAPRTTADYLAEREELRQSAANDMADKGLAAVEPDGDA